MTMNYIFYIFIVLNFKLLLMLVCFHILSYILLTPVIWADNDEAQPPDAPACGRLRQMLGSFFVHGQPPR